MIYLAIFSQFLIFIYDIMKGTKCNSCLRDKVKPSIVKASMYKEPKQSHCKKCFYKELKKR